MDKQEKKALETKLWWAIQNTENKLFALRLQLSELTGEPDEILDAPEAPVLTDEKAEVLGFMKTFSNPVGWWFNNSNSEFWTYHMNDFKGLVDVGYLIEDRSYNYQITDTGRAALKAHNEGNAS